MDENTRKALDVLANYECEGQMALGDILAPADSREDRGKETEDGKG